MEAAIRRIVVFGLARRTHRENFHRSVRAIVRQGFNDAEARATIRAVGERIEVAPIRRIENLAQAIRASGDIGQDERSFAASVFALANLKSRVTDGIEPRGFQALNGAPWRLPGFKVEKKLFEPSARAFGFDENSLRRIPDPARQSQFGRESENKRTKSDALHGTANNNFQSRYWRRIHGSHHLSVSNPSSTMSVEFTAFTSTEPHLGQTSGT
jgi:hypothetical protein